MCPSLNCSPMALTTTYQLFTNHVCISLLAYELCVGEDDTTFIFIYLALSTMPGMLLVKNLVEFSCFIILEKKKLKLKMNKALSSLDKIFMC